MKKRCTKCGGELLELWSEDKISVWIACALCDKTELDGMRRIKLEDDIDKVMGFRGKK